MCQAVDLRFYWRVNALQPSFRVELSSVTAEMINIYYKSA